MSQEHAKWTVSDSAFANSCVAAFGKDSYQHLQDRWSLYLFDDVDSTMNVAEYLHRTDEVARAVKPVCRASTTGDEPRRSIVYSRSQRSGRGREGRKWISEFGTGIYVTYALSPLVNRDLRALSLAVSLAVGRTARTFGVDVRYKWPNDVLIAVPVRRLHGDSAIGIPSGYGKLAGILVDVSSKGGGIEYLAIGIGINLITPKNIVDGVAASLSDVVSNIPQVSDVLAELTAQIDQMLNTFYDQGFESLKEEWEKASVLTGHRVRWSSEDKAIEGVVVGLDVSGGLVIARGELTERDTHTKVYSGRIQILDDTGM